MYHINMERSEMQKYREVGKRIQDARDKAGLTQEQLAVAVGYKSATAISLIETGERKLRVGELEKIANKLQSDMQYLLTGTTDKKVTVRMALRSEHKDLSADSINKIESFISFVKSEQDGRGGTSKK
ncbi:hypothetical protein B7Z00_00035 [Candidatus Saccharibacteria bacterium 32-50-10]|nr:MAG: hypothetical protein B7Z00_00035 [Candidatus Saccharibacteria bacterium 32-50-10]